MNWRVALAFVVAPAIVPLAIHLDVRFTSPPEALERAAIVHSMMLAAAYGIALLLGLPLHRYLQRRGLRTLHHYFLAGAALGLVPGVILIASVAPEAQHLGALIPLALGALAGAVSAVVFWMIGLWRGRVSAGSNNALERAREG